MSAKKQSRLLFKREKVLTRSMTLSPKMVRQKSVPVFNKSSLSLGKQNSIQYSISQLENSEHILNTPKKNPNISAREILHEDDGIDNVDDIRKITLQNMHQLLMGVLGIYFGNTDKATSMADNIVTKAQEEDHILDTPEQLEILKQIQSTCQSQIQHIQNVEKPIVNIQSAIRSWNIRCHLKLMAPSRDEYWNSLITSERQYVEYLDSIVHCYKIPIETRIKLGQFNEINQTTSLFLNIEVILSNSKRFLKKLELLHKNFPVVFGVGQTFLLAEEDLTCYDNYLVNLQLLLDTWGQIKSNIDKVQGFMIAAQATSKFPHLSLEDLLRLPIHHLGKYEEILAGMVIDLVRRMEHVPLYSSLKQSAQSDLIEQLNARFKREWRRTASLRMTYRSHRMSFGSARPGSVISSVLDEEKDLMDESCTERSLNDEDLEQSLDFGLLSQQTYNQSPLNQSPLNQSLNKTQLNQSQLNQPQLNQSQLNQPQLNQSQPLEVESQQSQPQLNQSQPLEVESQQSQLLKTESQLQKEQLILELETQLKEKQLLVPSDKLDNSLLAGSTTIVDDKPSILTPNKTPKHRKKNTDIISPQHRGKKKEGRREKTEKEESSENLNEPKTEKRKKSTKRKLERRTKKEISEDKGNDGKIESTTNFSNNNEKKNQVIKFENNNQNPNQNPADEAIWEEIKNLWKAFLMMKQKNEIARDRMAGQAILHQFTEQLSSFDFSTSFPLLVREGNVYLTKEKRKHNYFLLDDVLLLSRTDKRNSKKFESLKIVLPLKDIKFESEVKPSDPISTMFTISFPDLNKQNFRILLEIIGVEENFYRILKNQIDLKDTKVFGVDLATLIRRPDTVDSIPAIVRHTCDWIREYGIKEGIFRKSGALSGVEHWKTKYNEGKVDKIESTVDEDVVSNLLKLFLRELPDPLIPYSYYNQFMEGSDNISNQPPELLIPKLKPLLTCLPKPNYLVLRYLCQFLLDLSEFSSSTKMDISNLALVFATNILRPITESMESTLKYSQINHFFEFLIQHRASLFALGEKEEWIEEVKRFAVMSNNTLMGLEESPLPSSPSLPDISSM